MNWIISCLKIQLYKRNDDDDDDDDDDNNNNNNIGAQTKIKDLLTLVGKYFLAEPLQLCVLMLTYIHYCPCQVQSPLLCLVFVISHLSSSLPIKFE